MSAPGVMQNWQRLVRSFLRLPRETCIRQASLQYFFVLRDAVNLRLQPSLAQVEKVNGSRCAVRLRFMGLLRGNRA